jgi:two-component system NtrC family sensor kinase
MNVKVEQQTEEGVHQIVLDRDFKVVHENGTLLFQSGVSVTGSQLSAVLPRMWNNELAQFCRDALKGRTRTRTAPVHIRTGRPRLLSITVEPLVRDLRVTGIVLNIRDITEPNRRSHQLALKEKMDNLASLAAHIADKMNNPLATILNRIGSLLVTELKPEDLQSIRYELESIQELIYNMSVITNALEAFSNVSTDNFRLLHVNYIVEKAIQISKLLQLHDNISYKVDLAKDLPPIWGSEITLEQCLINIIRNAIEAMSENEDGLLKVTTSRDKYQPKFVNILIRDNGVGIPKENLHRIFDPFFRTKNDGHTGLGLSVGYGIIASHNGKIEINSPSSKGTRVSIFLPIARV